MAGGVEATGGTFDVAVVEEVFEGALNLGDGGIGEMGVEGGGRDGFGGIGDDGEDELGKELTMEGVGAIREELVGLEDVMAVDGDVSKVGVGGQGLDVEGERGGEVAVAREGVAEQDLFGLHGIGGK